MTSAIDDLRVVIVADDSLARAGLAAMLADQPGYRAVGQVAGQADPSTEGLPDLDVYSPDVILWGLGWDPSVALAVPVHAALAFLRRSLGSGNRRSPG